MRIRDIISEDKNNLYEFKRDSNGGDGDGDGGGGKYHRYTYVYNTRTKEIIKNVTKFNLYDKRDEYNIDFSQYWKKDRSPRGVEIEAMLLLMGYCFISHKNDSTEGSTLFVFGHSMEEVKEAIAIFQKRMTNIKIDTIAKFVIKADPETLTTKQVYATKYGGGSSDDDPPVYSFLYNSHRDEIYSVDDPILNREAFIYKNQSNMGLDFKKYFEKDEMPNDFSLGAILYLSGFAEINFDTGTSELKIYTTSKDIVKNAKTAFKRTYRKAKVYYTEYTIYSVDAETLMISYVKSGTS
jgi:hypothetical protein